MKKLLICVLCLLMLAGCSTVKNDSDRKDRDDDKKENNTIQLIDETTEPTTEEFAVPAEIYNTWFCQTINADGDEYVVILVLNEDGTAEYKTGYPNSELIEMFFGEWTLEKETLSLKVKGGMSDIDDGIENYHGIEGTYNWILQNNMLVISDLSGDGLLSGHATGVYTFTPFA